MKLLGNYPHLKFSRHWTLSPDIHNLLGQCEAYVEVIANTPMLPSTYSQLLNVSLIKGAQATTAIEGNTLSEQEIRNVAENIPLPPSKQYLAQEVKNVLGAFNSIRESLIHRDAAQHITPPLIQNFHRMIGRELGKHLDAIPGFWRTDNRVVGQYRCPDYRDVEPLIEEYCRWLHEHFGYGKRKQPLSEIIVQAIVAHVYFEWIHPFGDGNGRTGRLIEFYILLRGGSPDICSHILSNHYNQTRSNYYTQLELARQRADLTAFIEYAVLGFRDGLQETLQRIGDNLVEVVWEKAIYDKFDAVKFGSRAITNRRRALALAMEVGEEYSVKDVFSMSPKLAREYATTNFSTILRDFEALVSMEILVREKSIYRMNPKLLHGRIALAASHRKT
jgi:Fic family protein